MDELAWETVAESTAYSCPGFDIVREDVRLPDGTETDFDYLSEQESVVVLPFTPDDEVVLVEEWRHAVKRVNRGLPAGTTEPEEDPERAAARELREETGYEADALAHLTTVEPANGFSDAVFHYYVARGCEPTAEQNLDDDETIDVTTATLEDLLDWAREDDLRDGRTAFGVVYYALFEREGTSGT
jgi:ADP-ribose pyrophosphatase